MARQISTTSFRRLGLRSPGVRLDHLDRKRVFFSTGSRLSGLPPSLEASEMSLSEQPHHVSHIVEELRRYGILQISLKFLDNNSRYLRQLLLGFHQNHGHRLPIAHSATCGWFWDIRPSTASFQSAIYQARSETMDPFPWHTDCSYEEQPPRYFALQVIRPDRCGGGTFSLLDVRMLSLALSPTTKAALRRREYLIRTPPEFIKDPMRQSLVGSILEAGEGGLSDNALMRYRGDLVTPLSEEGARALKELKDILWNESLISTMVLSLSSAKMAEGSILLVDNRRWLHSRTNIQDPMRHLRRVRWDAAPFHDST
ncbi:CobW/HypB/UreG- nucleotide-binding domain-containing protein [Apiospora arundinis]